MATRLASPRKIALIIGAVIIALLGFILGGLVTSESPYRAQPGVTLEEGGVGSAPAAKDMVGGADAQRSAIEPQYGASPTIAGDTAVPSTEQGGGGPMIVRNDALELRVDEVESAIAAVRKAAASHDATISDLSVTGGEPDPRPLPAGEMQSFPSPASAYLTLRVPAQRLDALSAAVSKVGRVISQSGTSSDVTQQHLDLSARLKNLKAEETTLRTFLNRAGKISDLLAVEKELSRVRGEIEAMQAQVDFLERQAALSTLTVSMTEPGPVVSPAGGDWGFTDAIRTGIRQAATLITGLITLLIAVLPLAVLALVAFFVVRAINRRRSRKSPSDTQD